VHGIGDFLRRVAPKSVAHLERLALLLESIGEAEWNLGAPLLQMIFRWPDKGAAKTARLTWAAFALAPSRQEALRYLACLKGFYLNFYAAPLHKDSDENIESWTLRRLAPASEGRETPDAGATVLPLRGIAIHTRPDLDIVHAFFQQEEHGVWDDGAGRGRGVVDGHETAFHLQSGGASYKRLLAVREVQIAEIWPYGIVAICGDFSFFFFPRSLLQTSLSAALCARRAYPHTAYACQRAWTCSIYKEAGRSWKVQPSEQARPSPPKARSSSPTSSVAFRRSSSN
jgi:hypothetical protein